MTCSSLPIKPASSEGKELRWYHCLPASALLHGVVLSVCFMSANALDYHIFARRGVQGSVQTTAVAYIPVYFAGDEQGYRAPTAVDADENPFEDAAEIESAQPFFPLPVEESADNGRISDTAGSSDSGESAGGAAQADAGISAEVAGRLGDEGKIAVAEPRAEVPKPVQVSSVWPEYAKKLSAHFKKHKFYPDMAKRLRLSGTVKVSVELRRDGEILSTRIVESSGNAILDQAALQAVRLASPVPPFPEEIEFERKSVLIPYHYSIE